MDAPRRYLNFSPNEADSTAPWNPPPTPDGGGEPQSICQPPMAGCDPELHPDPADWLFPADYRIRPTICCHGTGAPARPPARPSLIRSSVVRDRLQSWDTSCQLPLCFALLTCVASQSATGHLDFSALLNEFTSDTKPCVFARPNSVTAREWTGCAERLGVTPALLANQAPAIQQGLDHMFDQAYGAFATGVTTAGTVLKKVPVTGPGQLACGIGLGELGRPCPSHPRRLPACLPACLPGRAGPGPPAGPPGAHRCLSAPRRRGRWLNLLLVFVFAFAGFSFGVGYDCQHFADCSQPGLTNHVLAASMLGSRDTLGCSGGGGGSGGGDEDVILIAQWEVTVALATLLRVDRSTVDTSQRHPSFSVSYGGRRVTVYIVGNPLRTVGAYISTDGVAEQMVDIIGTSGRASLAVFAHPEHLPRVYRSSISNFDGHVDATIFPAIIPYSLNYPVDSRAAVS
eukprot:SAG22_NODE_3064_length_1970_cov_1.613576_1_plen_456_part_10